MAGMWRRPVGMSMMRVTMGVLMCGGFCSGWFGRGNIVGLTGILERRRHVVVFVEVIMACVIMACMIVMMVSGVVVSVMVVSVMVVTVIMACMAVHSDGVEQQNGEEHSADGSVNSPCKHDHFAGSPTGSIPNLLSFLERKLSLERFSIHKMKKTNKLTGCRKSRKNTFETFGKHDVYESDIRSSQHVTCGTVRVPRASSKGCLYTVGGGVALRLGAEPLYWTKRGKNFRKFLLTVNSSLMLRYD